MKAVQVFPEYFLKHVLYQEGGQYFLGFYQVFHEIVFDICQFLLWQGLLTICYLF